MKKKSSNISLFTVILYTLLAVTYSFDVVAIINKSNNDSVFKLVVHIAIAVCWIFASVYGFIRLHRNKKEEKSAEDSTGESEEM